MVLVISLITNNLIAQEQKNAKEQTKTKFGIGIQATFPVSGLSGMVDVSDKFALEGLLGVFGILKSYGGRILYRFKKETYWNAYGYGMVGAWSYPGYKISADYLSLEKTRETVLGYGAGAGIEYNWKALNPNLPPLFFNLELGLGSVDFKEINYNVSAFMLGAGVHYRF